MEAPFWNEFGQSRNDQSQVKEILSFVHQNVLMKFQVILYPGVENEIIRTENCDCFLSEYLLKNTNNSHNVYIMDDTVLTPNAFIFVLINNFIILF